MSPLEEIAYAALEPEDLARGVCGTLTVEGLGNVRQAQALFIVNGWKRVKRKEGFTKLENRVYRKQDRWAIIQAGAFGGVFAEIEVTKREPY